MFKTIAFVLSVLLLAGACQTTTPPVGSELLSDDPNMAADRECTNIAAAIPGLLDWTKSVRSADGITKNIGLPYENLDRSDGYELVELAYAAYEFRSKIMDSADAIRRQGLGCVERFDAFIEISDNLVVLGTAMVSCTIPQEQYKAMIWTCPISELAEWRQVLVADLLAALEVPIEAPTPEYLVALKPWDSGSDDDFGLSQNLSSSTACNTASGLGEAFPLFWFAHVAGEDYRAEVVHSSPLSSSSVSDMGPVHRLWEAKKESQADDAAFSYFTTIVNVAARKLELASELRRTVVKASPRLTELCRSVTVEVEKLIGPTDGKVPKNSLGVGAYASMIEAFLECNKNSYQKKKAKELSDPLMTTPGWCVRRLYWGGFKDISAIYVDVMVELGKYSHFVSVAEATEQ